MLVQARLVTSELKFEHTNQTELVEKFEFFFCFFQRSERATWRGNSRAAKI